MDAPALPPGVLASLPPSVVAFIQWQTEQINRLTARVAELEAKLKKNPTNSSKPPSSTHPHDKPAVDKTKSKCKRGGQPGHDKHERSLLPTQECQEVVPCVPTECRRCGKELQGVDTDPLRHQVWELPEIKPLVTEYQQHRLTCSCGCSTCGALPKGVPTGQAGPRLVAFTALLMACFRQSKRRAAYFLSTILNQPASAGWMVLLQNRAAAAVLPAYNELAEQLPEEPMLNIDESPTKEGKSKAWVWTFVAATFTVFVCATSRAATVAQKVLGAAYDGIIHCDRARMYWCFGRLQWCWAHLKRDFQAWIDDPSCATKQQLGRDLMWHTKKIFKLWQKVRDGTLSRRRFRRKMKPIRHRVEMVLVRAFLDPLTETIVKELLEHIENLWTFVDVEGVEPTNNAAEQALRHAVIWRKLSFGTQSSSGSRFVERLLTVIETCRRQKRNAFAWLTEAVHADFQSAPASSLLSAA
jgi:transposase